MKRDSTVSGLSKNSMSYKFELRQGERRKGLPEKVASVVGWLTWNPRIKNGHEGTMSFFVASEKVQRKKDH